MHEIAPIILRVGFSFFVTTKSGFPRRLLSHETPSLYVMRKQKLREAKEGGWLHSTTGSINDKKKNT